MIRNVFCNMRHDILMFQTILPDVSFTGPIQYKVVSINKGCFWLPVCLIPKSPHENALDSWMAMNYMCTCTRNYYCHDILFDRLTVTFLFVTLPEHQSIEIFKLNCMLFMII